MGFRRKRVDKWSPKRWLSQVKVCFVALIEAGGTKATVVVHMDPDLLPKDTEDLMRQECRDAGEPWEGFREYAVFCLECSPSNYAGYQMGDTVHGFMKDLYREVTIEAAAETSRAWIGPGAIETDLRHLPGLLQAAFITDITGKEADLNGAESVWLLPLSAVPEQVIRYPTSTE